MIREKREKNILKKVVTMYVATRSAARFRVAGACGGVPLCLANPPPHLLRLLGAACDWDGVEGSSPIGRGLADELPNFNDVNVATAFSTFNKLCGSRSFPLNIAADDGFRGLMARARTMCADGRLKARELANLTHAVAKMSAAGKLAAADADVRNMLVALEQRAVLVASVMNSHDECTASLCLGDSRGPRHWRRSRPRWCVWVRTWILRPLATFGGHSRRWGGSRGLRRGWRWRRQRCG